ncbi:acetylxylan esterase [Kitasatospora viridis]|uniref:Cephalosporin-C deacetylase n=1 Tax=Kitasatospora viridis TaxID=281105 RepID=A0A561SEJ1_9ACTN|nr:acetylxylan esterase [Kitasatospora viridis]TWF73276.1 cephalosporin-C deacetylase [Kitasatospora viridis]
MTDFSHPFPFDPTYGHDLDSLLAVGPPEHRPTDFDAFWQARYAAAREVEVRPELGPPVARTADGATVHEVGYGSTGGVRLGGWLVRPADGVVERGLVMGHGYDGCHLPLPPLPVPRAAAFFPVARGLGARSLRTDIPADPREHVLHGIADHATYVIGDAVADLVWCAASALLELVPEAAPRLDYCGISFGGGVGALGLPWDDRYRSAHLTVPTFGNHPLRVTLECVGSGTAVRQRWLERPEVLDVLGYFDAATAATRLRIPVQVAGALFDPSVPPPGQFAVHNALAGERRLHVLPAGHFRGYPQWAADEDRLQAAIGAFLA